MQDNRYNLITDGPIAKGLSSLFFPILFGTFFQQLYNIADSIVVGKLIGKEALAAVGGGTSQIIGLIIGFVIGVSAGSGVLISQYYGNKDLENTKKSIDSAIIMSLAASIAITILGVYLTPFLLRLIKTPEDIFALSESYLKLYFTGSSMMIIYSMISGIFRSIGDGRRPLYPLVIGSILNVFLDLLLIGHFNLGVSGAALATVLSQTFCCIYSLFLLRFTHPELEFHFRGMSFKKEKAKKMLRIGIPIGIQAMMFTVSKLFLISGINAFGSDTAAAWAVYTKLDTIYYTVLSAFSMSITAYVGQNYGAGKTQRAKKAVRKTLLFSAIYTLSISLLYTTKSEWIYSIFTFDEGVIGIGHEIVMTIAPFLLIYLPLEILTGAIQGEGKIFVPTLTSIFGICFFRVIWLYTGANFIPTIGGLLLCYPLSWVINSTIITIYYLYRRQEAK